MPDLTTNFDPTIPMGIKPPDQSQTNPLTTIGNFANVQDKLNQIKLFQQTFAARQKAGEILATAPSLDEGLTALMKDPLTAPFSGEILNQVRQSMLSQLQFQGTEQEQAQNGFMAVMKALTPAMNDPTMFSSLVDAQLATLSPAAKARVVPAMESIKKGLLGDLPSDPSEARGVFNRRLAGLLAGAGITNDTIRGLTGTPAPEVKTGPFGSGGAEVPYQTGGPVYGGGPQVQLLGQGQSQGPGGEASANGLGSPATAPTGPISGPTITQQEYYKREAEIGADIESTISQISENVPLQLKRMDQIIDTMKHTKMGGFADIRGQLAKVLQGFRDLGANGITQADIDEVAGGNMASLQEFKGLIKRLATQQLSLDAKGQGRVMLPEVQGALESLSETQDPKAILSILNYTRAAYQFQYDRAQKLPQFKKLLANKDPSVAGLSLANYNQWYNNTYSPETLPEATPGGLQLGPKGGEGIIGLDSEARAQNTRYETPDDVVKAYKAKLISYDEAEKILKEQFGGK